MIVQLEQQINLKVDLKKYARLKIYDTIKNLILLTYTQEEDQHASMEVFGSVRQKLALDTSDIDIVILGVPCFGSKEIIN